MERSKYNKPWMHQKEIDLIRRYINPKTLMLEWGSGGSTFFFSELAGDYYSIEHDLRLGRKIKIRLFLHRFISAFTGGGWRQKIHFYLVKPNSANRSVPSKYEEFKDYIEIVDRLGVARFDVVLIDGRAREHCAERVLKYIDRDSIVFIHDFFSPGREYYSRVLQWYEVIDSVKDTPQTLAALRKKV